MGLIRAALLASTGLTLAACQSTGSSLTSASPLPSPSFSYAPLTGAVSESAPEPVTTSTASIASTSSGPSVAMTATASYNGGGFEKFIYSFPLPAGQSLWTGLSGTLSLQLKTDNFSEALISVNYIPSGPCPANGTQFSSYSAISAAYPSLHGLQNTILKQPKIGTSQMTLSESLPAPVPVSGCLVLIMDGGPATGNSDITMTSDLKFNYEVATSPAEAPYSLGGGSEFCFGQTDGCEAATDDPTKSFSYAVQVTQDSTLVALYGDIADSSFDGSKNFGAVPSGAWTMSTDYYVLPGGCGSFPVGASQAGNYYSMLPSNANHIHNVTLQGNGIGSLQTPVFQEFSNLTVHNGDCLVALVEMLGAYGGVDAENQVGYLMEPISSTPAPSSTPTATPTASTANLIPIYRMFNGKDHMPSVSDDEAVSEGYHLEGESFQMSASPGYDLTPIYRCFWHSGHFLSVDPKCEGQSIDGVIAYAQANLSSGVLPLYRFVNAGGFHLETTDFEEGASNGYNYEGILGYVWAP